MLKRLLPFALIILLTLVFFHQMMLTDKILARGDTYNYFYPYWDLRNAAFRAGELPLWSSDIFMGVPLLANPQLGSYYPPNWLTAPFRAPAAIKISILLHAILAGAGMLFLYRQVIGGAWISGLAAAAIFTFGGYLSAHVEQINQFQGLAWMPILFALYHRSLTGARPRRDGLLLALAWALQIFSGHTQTVFISGFGLGLYGLAIGMAAWRAGAPPQKIGRGLVILCLCALTAALLALPQLLPSLELTGISNRSGGLKVQATAFSLPPNIIGRAILPSYDGQLFGEYVTYLGVLGLGLAIWGMLVAPSDRKWAWILLAAVGLGLAFGRLNPIYLVLAELPGFNSFRVPARWLSLFNLAMALLAGLGVQALQPPTGLGSPRLYQGRRARLAVFVGIFIGGIILLTRFVLQPNPRDIFGGAAIQDSSLALWLLAWLVLLALLRLRHRWMPLIAAALVIVELFLASLILPYNDLSPPEVYLGQRFTISQLLAYQAEETAPGRTLSISQIYFDPGDIVALRERYHQLGMDMASQFHALDAVKKQEMLMPNLSLTWSIPTIDGFGGGILPTIYYSQFSSLLLPDDALRSVDGRLGERMALPECRGACIPRLEWLQLTDTRYLITDKVYDIWHEDIAYDTALAEQWRRVKRLDNPDDSYDEVRILHTAPLGSGTAARRIQGDLLLTITDWSTLEAILAADHSILAVTLVNSRRQQVFLQVQPPPLERILSSAIKIYRIPPDGSRARLAPTAHILPDSRRGDEAALLALANGGAVIHGDAAAPNFEAEAAGRVEFTEYSDTRAALQVQSPTDAWLILHDAYYPGWQATLNNEPVPIFRANVMFRAVRVPAGASTLIFSFEPRLWQMALYGGLLFWAIALACLAVQEVSQYVYHIIGIIGREFGRDRQVDQF